MTGLCEVSAALALGGVRVVPPGRLTMPVALKVSRMLGYPSNRSVAEMQVFYGVLDSYFLHLNFLRDVRKRNVACFWPLNVAGSPDVEVNQSTEV